MLLRITCTFLMLRQSVGKFVIEKKYNKKGIIMIYFEKIKLLKFLIGQTQIIGVIINTFYSKYQ